MSFPGRDRHHRGHGPATRCCATRTARVLRGIGSGGQV